MKKSTTLKISLFAFLSAITCTVGNYMLSLDVVFYVTQILWFVAYFFLVTSLCQVIYERVRFRITLIVFIMSFALAAYSIALFSLIPYGSWFEYYVAFFYLFGITALVSAIVLIARVIFFSSATSEKESVDEIIASIDTWVCVCGKENTGKFCSECGKPNTNE